MAKGTRAKLKRLYQNTYELLTEKWVESHDDSQTSRLQRFAQFWVLVFKSFARNRCPVRATALAYTTLLALVPFLAVVLSITSSLLQEKGETATKEMIVRFIDTAVPQLKLLPPDPVVTNAAPQSATTSITVNSASATNSISGSNTNVAPASIPPREKVVNYIYEFMSNIKVKTLGATGMAGLVMIAIMLLSTIEGTFNDIWGVTHGRSWPRRVVQYWAAISLGPIVLALAIVLAGNTYSRSAKEWVENLHFLGQFFFQALPFVYVSIAFALFYRLMPNTQVNWSAAAIGGIVGGSLWLLLNIFNTFFLTRIITWSKIYGTALALLPIFLLGLYFSWWIMLFGAQVAYAFQNRTVYVQEKRAESVAQGAREYVGLRIMVYLAKRFDRGETPPTVLEIATDLSVPSRLIGRVLQPLMEARLVHEVALEVDNGYAPARPIETIACCDVLQTLRGSHGPDVQTRDDGMRDIVCAEFERIHQAECRAGQVTLKQIVARLADHDLKHEQVTRGVISALQDS